MKIKKFTKIGAVAAAAAAAASIIGTAVPAFGAVSGSVTSVTGTSSAVSFNKYLLMPDTATTPEATMNFAIAAGSAVDANASTEAPAVYAGNDVGRVNGTPTIGTATFTNNQTTVTTENAVIDATDLSGGKKYATSPVAVDFSAVTFYAPGIYRYVITETGVTSAADIAKSNDTLYLDVYVVNTAAVAAQDEYWEFDGTIYTSREAAQEAYDNYEPTVAQPTAPDIEYHEAVAAQAAGYAIDGYVVHGTDAVMTRAGGTYADGNDADGDGTDDKIDGLQNDMTTKDLTVKKTIAGNMADTTKTFGFSLSIDDDGDPSTTLGNTYICGVYDSSDTLVETIGTISGDGTAFTANLKGGDYIKVTGLPSSATYTSTETIDADYKLTSITGADNSASTTSEEKWVYAGTAYTTEAAAKAAADAAGAADYSGIVHLTAGMAYGVMGADKNIVYTNTKEVTTPTGIVARYIPFIIMVGAGVAVAVGVGIHKKRSSEAED